MIRFPGFYYDGHTSERKPVNVSFDSSLQINICGDGLNLHYRAEDIHLQPLIGKSMVKLQFPDGALCEIVQHPDLQPYLNRLSAGANRTFQNTIHKFENHLPTVLLFLVASIIALFAVIKYGIPVAAEYIAHQIPQELEQSMGEQALTIFDEYICDKSQLPQSRQDQLRDYFIESIPAELALSHTDKSKIYFRHCEKLGANAFALPAGFMVFTDDLVRLANNDQELLGIFAHELGHIQHRHIMRHTLQDSATGLLLIFLTGDIGSASSLAATIPTVLVQAKFSRDFETESDDFAFRFFKELNLSPHYMADILERLSEEVEETEVDGFLSTHPLTRDRIAKFRTPLLTNP